MGVGANIKNYLAANGVTQAHVVRSTGIRPAKLAQCLKGERRISLDDYIKICACLHVPTGIFLADTGEDKRC